MICALKSGKHDRNRDQGNDSRKSKTSTQKNLAKSACEADKMGLAMPSIPGEIVLNRDTIRRMRQEAVVKTADEKLADAELRMATENRLKQESDDRKMKLKQQSAYRTKGPKLSQLDDDACKKINHLLNRAFELRQEQEPEIQHCNSLILSTKCHAIRCAQIEENELIQNQMKQENLRMMEIAEQQRILASKKYDQEMEVERLKKKKQATELMEQIKENEITREFEAARTADDAKIRKEAAMEAQRAVIRDQQEKVAKQAEMRKEFLHINTLLKDTKKMERDLIKMEIEQIKEFNRKKNERDKAYEDMVLKQKRDKEIEIGKVRASQQASQDLQAAKDELNMLRIQDQVEKEWRRKEREDVEKKIRINNDLKEARRQQIEGRMLSNVLEIQREKEEFDRIIKLNVEDIKKTKEQEKQFKMKVDEHQKNLLIQINEKEREKIDERKAFFHEGVLYQEKEAAKNKSLRETMQKKVEEIRSHNLPTKYVEDIKRQLKLQE